MKCQFILIATLLAASSFANASKDHDHAPKHGGIVSEVKEIEYELVAKPDLIQLYVRDHGKTVDVSKAAAKLTLLTGAEKQEVDLKPADGRFEAKGAFKVAPGTKAVAAVTVGTKITTVRFAIKK